jgi:hypothetical protein
MNDDEAKYLIDQYNKYASWRTKDTELGLSQWTAILAMLAILVSIVSLALRGAPLDIFSPVLGLPWVYLWLTLAIVVVCFVMYARGYIETTGQYADDAYRLLILEKYRSRFHSLPSLTLDKIVDPDFTPEKLIDLLEDEAKKLRKESEVTHAGSPQT